MIANECPICRHIERSLIDHAIAQGRPDSYLTNNFAADHESIRWHKENCLAGGEGKVDPAAAVQNEHQEQLREMREAALRIAAEASSNEKQWRTALAAMNAVSRLVVQEAKLRDRKRPAAPRLVDSDEWRKLRARILTVLDRFPGAREALIEELNDDQP